MCFTGHVLVTVQLNVRFKGRFVGVHAGVPAAGHPRRAQQPAVLVRVVLVLSHARPAACIAPRLRLTRLTIWWWCPVRREHSAGRAWYQLRGNKLYQHMGPGAVSEADLVYTVLGLGELEDGVEIVSGIRAFVINLAVHSGTAAEHPKKRKGSATDRGADAAPAEAAAECKIFYALSIDEAQHWLAALQDATDEDRVVPSNEAALVEWMKQVAGELRDEQSRGEERWRCGFGRRPTRGMGVQQGRPAWSSSLALLLLPPPTSH